MGFIIFYLNVSVTYIRLRMVPVLYCKCTYLCCKLITFFLLKNRLFVGLESASHIYVSEISPVTARGPLLGLTAPMTKLGTLLVFAFGSFLPWRMMSLIFSIYALSLFALVFLVHESPTFLLLKSKRQKAIQSLMWLRHDNKAAVNAEIEEMEKKLTKHETLCKFLKSLTHSSLWYPFVVLAILSILIGCSGEGPILSYTVIFFSLFNSNNSEYALSIILASVSLVGSLCLPYFSSKMGRTMILLVSGVSMSVSLTLAATFYSFDMCDWTISFIFAYIFSASFGMSSVPYMIIVEIFPGHARGVMTSLTTIFMSVPVTINTKLFLTLLDCIHPFGVLMYFAIFSLLAASFAKLFVPETHNKSIFQITEYFEKE